MREKLGLTQVQFSQLFDVSLKTISRLETEDTKYKFSAGGFTLTDLDRVLSDPTAFKLLADVIKTVGFENASLLVGTFALILRAKLLGGLMEKTIVDAVHELLDN